MEDNKKYKMGAWTELSIRIIMLFVTAMVISFTPQYLRGFFGDTAFAIDPAHSWRSSDGMIDTYFVWGFRHYLYWFMCISLFIVQVFKIIVWVTNESKRFT